MYNRFGQKLPLVLAVLALCAPLLGGLVQDRSSVSLPTLMPLVSGLPNQPQPSNVYFEPNLGQFPAKVQYIARGTGYQFYLTNAEAVIVLREDQSRADRQSAVDQQPTALRKQAVLRMELVSGNQTAANAGSNRLASYSDYYLGNDQSKWVSSVAHYERVAYSSIYAGIDIDWYGNAQGQLEHDFIVAAGADPSVIQLKVTGAEQIEVIDGKLRLHTSLGLVEQQAPVSYQSVAGQRRAVTSSYQLRADGTLGFTLGEYDRSQPLVIDPTLVWSTYLGGTVEDTGRSVAVDGTGNVYVTGETSSLNFPTLNPNQGTYTGGASDAFVTSYTSAGVVRFSTYLGGNNDDSGTSIALDGSGNAYVTGNTASGDFPVLNPSQATNAGGVSDAFVTSYTPAGVLRGSTFLGGGGDDYGNSITVSSSGNVYVTGRTSSTNFPTLNPSQANNGGGSFDAFVTSYTSAGAVRSSTYLGGDTYDIGYGIAVDGSGNVYVTGRTNGNFPLLNSSQGVYGGGVDDAFVTSYTSAGVLRFSTYLGGNFDDQGYGVAVDSTGNAYVVGGTRSTNFPTLNPSQGSLSGLRDAFVTSYTPAGVVRSSTYLGGSGYEFGFAIALDGNGNIYITGNTTSTDFPTLSPSQGSYGGGPYDAYASSYTPAGVLRSSTYLGGSGEDDGYGIAADSSGNTYVVGYTTSTNFPTLNASQGSNGGGGDAFVTKLNNPAGGTPTSVPSSPTACTVSFSDVPSSYIFYTDIQFLACRGVIGGFAGGTFQPNNNTTRGQFAKIAALGFGIPAYNPPAPDFSDVAPGNVFYPYVEAAYHAGVVNGLTASQCTATGTNSPCYGPNVQISRAQVAVIVQRARSYPIVTTTTPTFADVPAGNFAYAAVETLAGRNIISGAACTGGLCFRPNDNIRRGELSKVVRRAIESNP